MKYSYVFNQLIIHFGMDPMILEQYAPVMFSSDDVIMGDERLVHIDYFYIWIFECGMLKYFSCDVWQTSQTLLKYNMRIPVKIRMGSF